MKEIQLTAKFELPADKINDVKRIAKECMVIAKEKEAGKGLIQYDWFFSTDEKELHVRETYSDSNAVMTHLGNMGELLGQLMQISPLRGEIYGNLSSEVEDALKGLDIKKYSFMQGL